jgi:hypothetical protein
MLKAYMLGMQSLAWEGIDSLLQGSVPREAQQSRTVHRIANHRVPNICQVYADLVRASGFKGETQETYRPPGFYHPVVGTGRTAVAFDHSHLLPMLGMASNRRVNSALQCWEASAHQRHIAPL